MNLDRTQELIDAVKQAHEQRRSLRIVGGNTKAWYGRKTQEGEPLHITGHCGIVGYDASELVITARAGTPIATIEAALDTHRQTFGFEAPQFGAESTLGGVVAAGLAGPRRPFAGAIRDSVLGAKVLNGCGEVLQFGGVVFKNVAGFDAFRLMAGSLGCLGVLLEVSLRVLPKPVCERAVIVEANAVWSQQLLSDLLRQSSPISGACYDGATLHLRLSGGNAAVEACAASLPGTEESLDFWSSLRDFQHPFFAGDERLWRISTPAKAAELDIRGRWLWDWAGMQRWLISAEPPKSIRRAAAAVGGHATLFRGALVDEEVFSPLPHALFALHRRLKAAFDPAGIFNPGRMYAGL